MNNKFPMITVVIATYDCERTIEKCLLSIKKQTYPSIDIVVVDSLYYDQVKQKKCRKIIEKYARYFQDGPERSIQRNRGIKEARGELILNIDQDMYLTENVVKDCYEMISSGKYVALTIPEISIGVGFWTKCVALERYVSVFLENGMNECCRFFRKQDALVIGGFDTTIVGVEDSDFHYRMQARGKIGKIKSYIDHDEGRTRFFGRIKKKYYYSIAFREYLRRYPNVAVRQFFPIKKAYIKHWKIFLRHPILTGGAILLRSAEVAAGLLGLVIKNNYVKK
jgi:glycosyltransferase involved in cell wall biosynthesis